MRTVTVTVGNDPMVLGSIATNEDLQTWAENLCRGIEKKFGVSARLVHGTSDTPATCDDDDVNDWLHEIAQTDEWTCYL